VLETVRILPHSQDALLPIEAGLIDSMTKVALALQVPRGLPPTLIPALALLRLVIAEAQLSKGVNVVTLDLRLAGLVDGDELDALIIQLIKSRLRWTLADACVAEAEADGTRDRDLTLEVIETLVLYILLHVTDVVVPGRASSLIPSVVTFADVGSVAAGEGSQLAIGTLLVHFTAPVVPFAGNGVAVVLVGDVGVE
jgi:hypothetical protein